MKVSQIEVKPEYAHRKEITNDCLVKADLSKLLQQEKYIVNQNV